MWGRRCAAAARDPRIRYEKIDNTGIAANTNRAAALADGEYLALADHDDELAPHAVYTMGRAILAGEAHGSRPQFLYSDEALFRRTPRTPTWPTSSRTMPPST